MVPISVQEVNKQPFIAPVVAVAICWCELVVHFFDFYLLVLLPWPGWRHDSDSFYHAQELKDDSEGDVETVWIRFFGETLKKGLHDAIMSGDTCRLSQHSELLVRSALAHQVQFQKVQCFKTRLCKPASDIHLSCTVKGTGCFVKVNLTNVNHQTIRL